MDQPDLVPLWDRPPDFLPLHPTPGAYRWRYAVVHRELARVSKTLDKAASERRVALLANPALNDAATVDGLHAGIQMLLPGESAAAHRHTPSALRIGIEGADTVTEVDEAQLSLGPLDVVLNPSGTWHGHAERAGVGAVWLDIVDLPLVAALGGVHFEPSRRDQQGNLLDPPAIPTTLRYGWPEARDRLSRQEPSRGVRTLPYGGGSVLPTLAVTAYALEAGSTLQLPARTAGAVVLIGDGAFESPDGPCERFDVIALRSWTPYTLTATSTDGVVLVTDTSPALRALGLYR